MAAFRQGTPRNCSSSGGNAFSQARTHRREASIQRRRVGTLNSRLVIPSARANASARLSVFCCSIPCHRSAHRLKPNRPQDAILSLWACGPRIVMNESSPSSDGLCSETCGELSTVPYIRNFRTARPRWISSPGCSFVPRALRCTSWLKPSRMIHRPQPPSVLPPGLYQRSL